MTFPEFFRRVKGFERRQEMAWRRTYRIWATQVKEPPTFDEFMGRRKKLEDMSEEEILGAWEEVVG
jgi:hypothetical protein